MIVGIRVILVSLYYIFTRVSKHDRPGFILVEKFYFSEGIIINRTGRIALILLLFFALVDRD